MLAIGIYWDEHKQCDLVAVDGCEEQPSNLLIRDIPQKWQPQICEFMVKNSFRQNRLLQQLKMHEQMAQVEDYYRRIVMHVLRDECSIMVIDEQTQEICGVALVKCMSKKWRSWNFWLHLLADTDIYGQFMLLQRMLVLNYEQEDEQREREHEHELEHEQEREHQHNMDSLHLFEYYLRPVLHKDDIFMMKFFKSICAVARHVLMARVSFVANTLLEQTQVKAAGFTELTSLIYSLVEIDGMRKFQTLRDINEMYMILYERQVEPLIPFYRMPPPFECDEKDRQKYEVARVAAKAVEAGEGESIKSKREGLTLAKVEVNA